MTEPRQDTIQLGHGSGGRWSRQLVDEIFVARLGNRHLAPLGDSALLPPLPGRLAMTTDSYVVQPLFFPGGDIGALAVNGTVNDLAVAGARPRYLSCGFILEEGLPLADLARVVDSMARAAVAAGVEVVTGDTKVVQRGKGDGVFVNTAGLGALREDAPEPTGSLPTGAGVLVSGPLGDHGAVVLAAQAGVALQSALVSDCAPVTGLVDALYDAGVRPLFLRDPTRGGLAAVTNEMAAGNGCAVALDEARLPIRAETAAICEILGLEPLHLACEGRVLAVLPADQVEQGLEAWRGCPGGAQAAVIGRLVEAPRVLLETGLGGLRVIDRPASHPLPRIC